jgi:hypothetical protein
VWQDLPHYICGVKAPPREGLLIERVKNYSIDFGERFWMMSFGCKVPKGGILFSFFTKNQS